jgi:hypothetical protein
MTEEDEETKPQPDVLTAVEDVCRDIVTELAVMLKKIRDGELTEIKTTGTALRELRAAFLLAMEERAKVEKLRKHDEGVVHNYALDFDSARDEIGRRLDRLGRARGD